LIEHGEESKKVSCVPCGSVMVVGAETSKKFKILCHSIFVYLLFKFPPTPAPLLPLLPG
jgi:hypothetical protein